MLAAVGPATRAVLLCSPNNPTGPALRHDDVVAFVDAVPDDVLVVVDEAYVEFVTDPTAVRGLEVAQGRDNVVVLRTFSKAYGLAGFRVGYCVAEPRLAAAVRAVALPFGVSLPAQAAVIASLEQEAELLARVAELVTRRDALVAGLRDVGLPVPDAQGNFVWIPAGARTAEVAATFGEAGLVVRPVRRRPAGRRRPDHRRRARGQRPRARGRGAAGRNCRRPRLASAGMAKTAVRPGFVCTECGWTTVKWQGRCGECQTWGSVGEAGAPKLATVRSQAPTAKAVPIAEVDPDLATRTLTGVGELDRVLGDGIVPGAVVLLAGEPGVGKSTLLLEVAARWAKSGRRTLYVSGEESAAQVRLRAGRTQRAGRRALPRRGDRPRHRPRPHRGGRALADGARLRPDRRDRRGRGVAGRSDPGPRGDRRRWSGWPSVAAWP